MISLFMKGRYVNLREELGIDTINKIENLFQKELNVSFISLAEDTNVIEMDFNSKMESLSNGICGVHFEDKKEVWLSDIDNIQTLVHEFTHVAQCRRTGLKHNILRGLTRFSNRMIMKHNNPIFYRIDLYEREAWYMASKI